MHVHMQRIAKTLCLTMSEPPNKRQRMLTDFFSAPQVGNGDTSCPKSVTINITGNSITTSATGDGATSSVNHCITK